jgi:hypothetical protein
MDYQQCIDLSTAIKKARQKPGGSNAGKYKGVKSFCGPSGGAPKGSYPVNSCHRTKSAKKLAHNAPNPSGISRCAERAAKRMGCK